MTSPQYPDACGHSIHGCDECNGTMEEDADPLVDHVGPAKARGPQSTVVAAQYAPPGSTVVAADFATMFPAEPAPELRAVVEDDVAPPTNVPRVRICSCGTTVHLTRVWANTCPKCSREYNGSGQMLARREHWGEETGEDGSLDLFDPDRDADDAKFVGGWGLDEAAED